MNFKNFYYLKLIFLIVFLFLLLHMIFYAVIVIMKLLMGIKKDENTKEIYDLDKYTQNENFCRLDYIFSKYQKLFLVLKKSNQRIMDENTIKDIVKFI